MNLSPKLYSNTGSWFLAVYNRVLRKLRFPLPWRGSIVRVYLKDFSIPFIVRLGSTDFHVLEEIFFNGEYSAVVSRVKPPLRLIVDLGANAGFSIRYWLENYQDAHIIAVEPDPQNALICRKNIGAVDGGLRVTFVESCIGARARTVYLESGRGEWGVRMNNTATSEGSSVEAVTMDDLLNGLQLSEMGQGIDLLKCDIEGSETELFKECASWIRLVRNMVIEVHNPYLVSDLVDDLRFAGSNLEIVQVSEGYSCSVVYLSNRS